MRVDPGYPKQMTHPAYQPAVISNSRNHNTPAIGQPVRFPPVWVSTKDDQDYYESRGYVAQG